MPRIFVVDRPMQTFAEVERRARDSLVRPLEATDYYLARFMPKDKKRANDGYSLGATYLERHALKNWKSEKKCKAVVQGALAPVVQVAAYLGCALVWLPNATVLFLQRVFPMKERSPLATREDVMARALYPVSKVINAFAAERQYHDHDCLHPVSSQELREVYFRTDALINDFSQSIRSAPPRIRDAKSLATSLGYLDRMNSALEDRLARR